MRIVITGASGNVGTPTLLALGAEGRHELVGVSRRTAWPPKLLRAVAAATWHARLRPTEPGWLDVAANVPRLDTTRQHGGADRT